MKVCIAASGGGHLTEILQIKDAYGDHEHFYVTFRRADTMELSKREKVYFVIDPKRNPLKLILNAFQSLWVAIKERPRVVISTGAGVALPIFFFSKIVGAKTIFIESFCRIRQRSLSARIAYIFADVFLVQWREMLALYGKKARYEGSVF